MRTMHTNHTLPARRVHVWVAAAGLPSCRRQRRIRAVVLAAAGSAALLAVVLLAGVSGSARHADRAVGSVIDTRLIVQARTAVQVARVRDVRLTLVARPLLPGMNSFSVLVQGPRGALGDAHVEIVAAMPGMAMRPRVFVARERLAGRYDAGGSLPMFGSWRLTVRLTSRAARRHGHPWALAASFTVLLDLPPAILRAAAQVASGR